MLKKLLKYELKATGRMFLPLYGTVLVLGLINKLFYSFNSATNFLSRLPLPLELTAAAIMLLYVFVIVSIFVMTLIVAIQRFHKNLLGDEGYLMFTLPVKTWQHILSKMLVAGFWFLISVLVTVLSVLIIGLNWGLVKELFTEIPRFFRAMYELTGPHGYFYVLEICAILLTSLASGILMIYTAMSLGHLLSSHRLVGAFGAFLALNFTTQLITGIMAMAVNKCFSLSGIQAFFETHQYTGVHIALLGTLLWGLLFCAVYFMCTKTILQKRLNLE